MWGMMVISPIYKIGASLLFMLLSCTIFGLFMSSMNNWYINSSSIMVWGMLWLVGGAIFISMISSLKKQSILWILMLQVLMMGFFSNSLFMFYIFFELSLVPILLMIMFWGSQPERLSAGIYLLMYTSLFSMPYILIILWMDMNFMNNVEISNSALMNFILLMPFLVKMPVMGLHFWLPKAHVEASTSGSMILAGVLLKLGSYGVYRIISIFTMLTFKLTSSLWLILALFSSILTFMQTDVKKLVAYSSVTHMTFLMISMSISNKLIFFNCLILSLSHGWVSMGMFYHAGTLSNSTTTRLAFNMSSESKFHWWGLLAGLFLVMNAALPPFPSFFAEVLTLSSWVSISSMFLLFIFYSLFVCYYNTYLYMWLTHMKSQEMMFNTSSSSEANISNSMILLSVFTLMWILIL